MRWKMQEELAIIKSFKYLNSLERIDERKN